MITDTLGIQRIHRVCLRGITNPVFASMVISSVDYPPTKALSGRFDVIVAQMDSLNEDLASIPQIAKHLETTGVLWVLYPSEDDGTSNEMQVRTTCFEAGLALRKRCEFSITHAAASFAPRANVIRGTI